MTKCEHCQNALSNKYYSRYDIFCLECSVRHILKLRPNRKAQELVIYTILKRDKRTSMDDIIKCMQLLNYYMICIFTFKHFEF